MNHPEKAARQRTASKTPTDPDLVDRLARLRTILPLLATDLAITRRHAHTLQRENKRLTAHIAQLESKLTGALDRQS
jgi:hypothetical protein